MAGVTEMWQEDGPRPQRWDRVAGRRWSAILYTFMAFGSNYTRMYSDVKKLRAVAAGAAMLDVPCGGGTLLRELEGSAPARYVGVDVSSGMLARAAQVGARYGWKNLELLECDVVSLPFDSEFDLCTSYMGLHCFPDPAGALKAMGTALKPGGTMRGSAVVLTGARRDRIIRSWQSEGAMGAVGTVGEIESWLTDCGLVDVEVKASGSIAYFSAKRPL
ncbi:class I SAM-dependent methyltransferase [Nocardia sp. NPDC059764]|uniref:class I SAM-dependent methyltransferase n=1 Tax=Nocardia sp. NPDC059764 TaxID=3346939 RepID=UPI00365B854A